MSVYGGTGWDKYNFAEFLENFIANFGYNPFVGTGIGPSEGDIPNVEQINPDDVWENMDPTIKQFMVILSKYLEGLDSDDMDRIARQEEANRWLDMYNKYKNGEISLEELSTFEPVELAGMPGWDDYFQGIISGGEEQGDPLQEYYDKYGKEVVDDVISKVEEITGKIGEAADDPIGALKGVLDNILPSLDDCGSWTDPCTSGGNPCWKDCVKVGVIFGIPGIPLPPGMAGATVRDIENAVKETGATIQDIIDGKPVCGENKDQPCTPTQVLEDLKDWVVGKAKDLIDGGTDPAGIYDWMKGILGTVISGYIWDEVQDTVTDLFNVGGADFDCASVGKEQVAGALNEEGCGACLDGYQPTADGGCIEGLEPCEGNQVRNEVTGDCEDPISFKEGDPCNENGQNGVYDADGNCIIKSEPDVQPTTDGEIWDGECTSPRPNAASSFAHQAAYRQWNAECGATHCPSGTPKIDEYDDCSGNYQPDQQPDPEPEPDEPPEGGVRCEDGRPPGYTFETQYWMRYCSGTHCYDGTPKATVGGVYGANCAEYQPPQDPEEPPSDGVDCENNPGATPLECGWVECPSGGFAPTEEECGGSTEVPGAAAGGGGGGGGFGGGGNLFDTPNIGITGDPQLLGRLEFPITDFLTGIFTGERKV